MKLAEIREGFRLLPALAKEAFREGREHPALWAAIVMRPMGFKWENHRWVERSGTQK